MTDLEWRWRHLAEIPSNTHSKRSLIRTSQVSHRRLAVGRRQQVKEYKHTHTRTHAHTHTRTHAHTHTEENELFVCFKNLFSFPKLLKS